MRSMVDLPYIQYSSVHKVRWNFTKESSFVIMLQSHRKIRFSLLFHFNSFWPNGDVFRPKTVLNKLHISASCVMYTSARRATMCGAGTTSNATRNALIRVHHDSVSALDFCSRIRRVETLLVDCVVRMEADEERSSRRKQWGRCLSATNCRQQAALPPCYNPDWHIRVPELGGKPMCGGQRHHLPPLINKNTAFAGRKMFWCYLICSNVVKLNFSSKNFSHTLSFCLLARMFSKKVENIQ